MGELTVLVDRLRRDRRRDPRARRREYSQAARELAVRCERLLATGVVPVLRRAVDRITKALMYMDDSSGIVGDDLREMMALYAPACAVARPDAKSLARWLVTLAYDGPGWPEIRLREFASALGERGLAEIAALVEQRAAVAGPGSWGRLFATRTLREQMAEISGARPTRPDPDRRGVRRRIEIASEDRNLRDREKPGRIRVVAADQVRPP
jgi:hypothetical protein